MAQQRQTSGSPPPRQTPASRPRRAGARITPDLAFHVALVLFLVYALHRVDHLALCEFDESRNVSNAFEMAGRGDWLALHFDGSLDHWNLKPPLFMWILATLFKWFGYSELAARVPSVLFGVGTALLIRRFVTKVTGDRTIASIVALGLLTTTGFYGFHALTSADVDMALVFFDTLSFFAIHAALIEGRRRWLWVLGASLGMGFMVKSLVGLLPILFIPSALALGRDPGKLFNRDALIGLAGAGLITVPWLIARETRYPDHYLSLMLGTDILRRGRTVVEQHFGDLWFYARWANFHLGAWLYAALGAGLACLASLVNAGRGHRARLLRTPAAAAGIFTLGCVLLYFVVFSSMASKLSWYLFPAYVLLFVMSGISFAAFMPMIPRWLRAGLLITLLTVNAYQIRAYDSHRGSGVDVVDFLLLPFRDEIRHHPLLAQGDLHQNGRVLANVYSDFRVSSFPGGQTLESMQRIRPDADFLITEDGRSYMGNAHLRALRILERPQDPRRPTLFEILRP